MRKKLALLLLLAAFSSTVVAVRAEVDSKITATVSQEYNDNVNESSHPKSDFISTLTPSLLMNYKTSRIESSIDYKGDFRKYDTNQRQDEILNTLTAKATVQAVENLLALSVSDNNSMVFTSSTQGDTQAADATANQVNQNVFTAGATLTPHFADRTKTSFGYLASDTMYSSLGDSQGSGGVNKISHTVFLDVLHELTPRLEIGASAKAQQQTTDQGNQDLASASGVARYTYGEDSYLFVRFGATESRFDNRQFSLLPTWSAGLTHTLGRTVFSLESQGDYSENPSSASSTFRALYTATVSRQFDRARITLNTGYSDFSGQDTQQTNTLTSTAQLEYELTPRLTALVSASRVNSSSSGNATTRLYGTAEMRYQLPRDTSVRLYYRHKDYNAENASAYQVNILGLALSKTF